MFTFHYCDLIPGTEFLCSLWHVGIYSSAFLILCSTTKPTGTPERANLQQGSDPEASPMLGHTVELDAFAAARSLDD
jgi:hypothetical protein